MKPVKRIEIVVETLVLSRVTELIERAGIAGYTVIRNAGGKGTHGERFDDELVDLHRNSFLVVACEADQVDSLLATLRPLLSRYGGMCLVSDAHWVVH